MKLDNLYTLNTPMTGIASKLNGKLFRLVPTNDQKKRIQLVDLDNNVLWTTAVVKEMVNGSLYKIIRDTNGDIYTFVPLTVLLPTKANLEQPLKSKEETTKPSTEPVVAIKASAVEMPTKAEPVVNLEDIVVVEETPTYRDISYGDGWDGTEFEFNRPLTKEEFIAWYEKTYNYKMVPEGPWYQDYDKIEGSGQYWTRKFIRRYTD